MGKSLPRTDATALDAYQREQRAQGVDRKNEIP